MKDSKYSNTNTNKPQFYPKWLFLFVCIAILYREPKCQTLAEEATKVGLNFGTAVGASYLSNFNTYGPILKSEFNIIVSENDMKFANTEPSRGQFTFAKADAMVKFGQDNGKKIRGHTLVWHQQTSNWVMNGKFTRQELLNIMKDHIQGVVGNYKGKILEWDVVNEAVDIKNPDKMRVSFWKTSIGVDFIDSAFVYAHRTDPSALLYYNDFGADGMNAKSDKIYELVKGLKSRGIPIHGVGLQAHVSAGSVTKAAVSANIKRLGELGLRVSITELDINAGTNLTKQWSDMLEACLENANCTSFLTWGIDDKTSWRGSDCNCLIWDKNTLPKKEIYDALRQAFQKADPTIPALRKKFIQEPLSLSRNLSVSHKKQNRLIFKNGSLFIERVNPAVSLKSLSNTYDLLGVPRQIEME